MPTPVNWFKAFPNIFPQWFIQLGDHIDIWPYVPLIYIAVWMITIPDIIFLLIITKNYKEMLKIKS